MTCRHEFTVRVAVAIFEDKPGHGSAEITGHCIHCAAPLVFQGPRGTGNQPMASVDRTELRAPVTFGHSTRFQPGPEFSVEGPEIEAEQLQ